ncbi:sulfate transporter family protein [Grosmannia clavigera kw1407]|uniref:Sulfate transporter family protein n=1 Tax=Grosmannia clavigera (strain kw1407 / UAMH 11150) TaxID=655863 RepID=F0XIE4_GROCL|nr:sulfate transporter family protein [Grosmannia clavigera kw1407]EFX02498.1 sulfate transporter family protein [Grosmannia clavigera kw1407]
MALTITDIVGEDRPDAVIATTITSYALSSVVTGLVFYCMGRFRFGYIVGFIPRHILIGCIGGVGWFLVATGFEVTARIEGSLNYDIDTLHKLVQRDTIPLWGTPLALSIVLFWSQKRISNKYFLPLFIIAIPFLFYFIVAVAGSFNQSWLRSHEFDQVHWGAIARCVPAMFALTFFGILHVPINVPALALNIGEDHADLNHELKLHGFSNMLPGALGSIQNYLVYANTLFFMRSGGDSRLAGFELAAFTFCVMLVGPKTFGFIPIMMVGCLIFDLGFELLVEAVWQPRKKLKRAEYVTVIAIVLIMGTYDFVVGIGVGILLAFVSLIIQTSQVSAIRAAYSGDIVNSTVRRNPSQQNYLRIVGCQICIIKLEGYLFFGTIVGVEDKIRELISDDSFHRQPIRYLILDLRHVTGLDYSAGEAFNTISRLLDGKGIQLVVSGVDAESELGHDLRAVGLGEDDIEVVFLPEINTALELCENELLKTLYASQEAHLGEGMKAGTTSGANGAIATTGSSSRRHLLIDEAGAGPSLDMLASSPRRNHLQAAARELLDNTEDRRRSRWQNFSDPLRLMLQIFQDVSDKDVDFWFRAGRYFQRLEYVAGDMLFSAGAVAEGFFLLEKGIVRAEYSLAHGQCYHENIVAGTTCGELPFFSETARTATAYADMDCTVWVLTREAWQRLQKEHPDVASELLRVSLKLTAERMSTVPSSTMLMAD